MKHIVILPWLLWKTTEKQTLNNLWWPRNDQALMTQASEIPEIATGQNAVDPKYYKQVKNTTAALLQDTHRCSSLFTPFVYLNCPSTFVNLH